MCVLNIPDCASNFKITDSHHSVVVFPRSTEDVSKIVKIASKYSMPVTPFAGGTSLEGNFRAVSNRTFHCL